MSAYLDYNASAPIDLRVLDCMVDVYKNSIPSFCAALASVRMAI